MTELIPGLVCIYNIHTGEYMYVNATTKRMLGYDKSEWLSGHMQFVASLIHPDDLQLILQQNTKALEEANRNPTKTLDNEPIASFEYRIRHKNGSYRWVKTDGVVFSRDALGKVEHVMNISIDITKRKERELKEHFTRQIAEREQQKGAVKTNSVIEQFGEAYMEIDRAWKFARINRVAETFLKKKRKELIGKKITHKPFFIKKLSFCEAVKRVMHEKTTTQIESYDSNHNRWYESNFYPTDEGVVILVKDTTGQRRLEGIEKNFAAIIASSNDAIISKNLKGEVTSWNKAAERIFGYTQNEVVGKNIKIIIPKWLHSEEAKILEKLARGVRIEHFETTRLTKGGDEIQVSLTISPIKDKTGKIIGASKIARDITKQKHSENNVKFLSEANKLLSSSLDYNETLQRIVDVAVPHVGDWCTVDILDKNDRLQQVATAHKDPKKLAWVRNYRKLHPPATNESLGTSKVIKTGKSVLYKKLTNETLTALSASKRQIYLIKKLKITSIMTVPILANNKVLGAISFRATGSKHNYTKEDLEMAEELASRASLAMQNARLYTQAQNEIEHRKNLEKQKDEFIAVASHELKTPVTSIKSYTQVLRIRFLKEKNQKAADMLAKLDAQVNKLTNLIENLLDVTNLTSGKMHYNEEYFALDELIDELIEELQRTTGHHTLEKVGYTRKIIYADRERVGQVFTNLVTNAIKYSPHARKVTITLSAEKNMAMICVHDYGIGIDKSKQKMIFDRFFRASGHQQHTFPGLGLGLYVSREIVMHLGGKIWVESKKGKGSSFYFTIPIKKAPQ